MGYATLHTKTGQAVSQEHPLPVAAGIRDSETATQSDSADLGKVADGTYDHARFLNLNVAGTVKVTYASGTSDTCYLTAGVWHPMDVTRVWSTGTDAGITIKAGY